jgi:hypothetical protein
MWSSVGSVGIVDSSDVGKVVFIGSIAQLGVGILPPLAEASVSPPIEERFRTRSRQRRRPFGTRSRKHFLTKLRTCSSDIAMGPGV